MTKEVIRIHMEAIGKGPRRAFTHHRDTVLFTILEGTLTPGEQRLAANGNGESVRAHKRLFHKAMDGDLRDAVSRLTGRQVVAFLSDIHLDPDVVVEFFILDRPMT